ncbi:uncharacterized protein TNCT_358872 [Trichonephila clavata]|uniref:Uncharacterized protein n=1 Tax=Trichonephila clavata TaxID=2740835 RepID=A0A8X6HFQ1_TRICU|nr:uncharacterized protein TNCT_358872 [Trichonephila clavata]
MENIMGSFYTKEELPQYCYTLYSLWGQPNKERERFPKGAIMRLHFFLNASLRSAPGEDDIFRPKHNIPSTPAVQIAVHSPYYLPSPYLDGANYLGGRSYEIRLRNIISPVVNGRWNSDSSKAILWGVVEECRMNQFYEGMGCVPLTVDYPHQYTVCRSCPEGTCKYEINTDNCTLLAEHYNQPCDSLSYTAIKEQKVISYFQEIEIPFINEPKKKEGARWRLAHHDCEGHMFWSRECSTIDIDILFDRFEITSLTYNPKFEDGRNIILLFQTSPS